MKKRGAKINSYARITGINYLCQGVKFNYQLAVGFSPIQFV